MAQAAAQERTAQQQRRRARTPSALDSQARSAAVVTQTAISAVFERDDMHHVVRLEAGHANAGVNWGWCGIKAFVAPRELYSAGSASAPWIFTPFVISTSIDVREFAAILRDAPGTLKVEYVPTVRTVYIARK